VSAEHSRLSSEGANAPLSTRASDTHSYVARESESERASESESVW
jgi:hypothetical protein